jgi:glyoxylase-like metal-dependent hydrolase (beta-lactamase superfamily II)
MGASAKTTTLSVRRFDTAGGVRVFQIPLRVFPILHGWCYLVLLDDPQFGRLRVLIDAGSGMGESNADLEAGLQAASELAAEPLGLEQLTHIFITHGHIDHFGGLSYVRPRTQARIGVHELDLRNLTHYEERLAVVARRLDEFLVEAGVANEERLHLIQMYKITKSLYSSVRVDFTYEQAGMRLGPFEFLHVPGHCAGHVVIRLHDLLFSGDHVLDHTSPHQSPERLTLSTGLDHYLKSLDTLEHWIGQGEELRLVFGGHENPITDLPARLAEIREIHRQHLEQVQGLLDRPRTVAEVSHELFGTVHGYNVLLALEEAGAHIEYLYQRGALGIDNLGELEAAGGPVAIRYRRIVEMN